MYSSKPQKSAGGKIYLLIFILVLLLLPYLYWGHLNSAVDGTGQPKPFVIESGESTDSIIDRLKSEGFIRSPLAFKVYLKTSGVAGKLQAGDFRLSPSMSLAEIAENLTSGAADKNVTLIEGWRDEEMAARLTQELGIRSDEFLKVAREGYMFPDTYSVKKDATAADVATLLRKTFDLKYSTELQAKVKSKGLTVEQGVILASIVEREARTDEVRQKVASIYLKRFKIGMALDADATVQYALGYQPVEKTWWKHSLTLDDLKVNSVFNTYTNPGLPPSPICNPSLSSLTAVANADSSTPFLYYFHDSQGNSYYARTLEEHNANVAAHR